MVIYCCKIFHFSFQISNCEADIYILINLNLNRGLNRGLNSLKQGFLIILLGESDRDLERESDQDRERDRDLERDRERDRDCDLDLDLDREVTGDIVLDLGILFFILQYKIHY